jgi:hypothetical protein
MEQRMTMTRMTNALKTLALVLLALALGSGSAFAQQSKESFTPERFAALQQQGALILVDVYADWCGTCAKQQQILAEYREQHPDVPLHISADRLRQPEGVRPPVPRAAAVHVHPLPRHGARLVQRGRKRPPRPDLRGAEPGRGRAAR